MGFYWSYTFLLKPSIRCTLALFSQRSTTLFLQLSLVSYCEHLTCSLNLIVETIQRREPTQQVHYMTLLIYHSTYSQLSSVRLTKSCSMINIMLLLWRSLQRRRGRKKQQLICLGYWEVNQNSTQIPKCASKLKSDRFIRIKLELVRGKLGQQHICTYTAMCDILTNTIRALKCRVGIMTVAVLKEWLGHLRRFSAFIHCF